jgi:hypothetical protein
VWPQLTRGSSFVATPGWRAQSLRDWPGPHLGFSGVQLPAATCVVEQRLFRRPPLSAKTSAALAHVAEMANRKWQIANGRRKRVN